MSAFYVFVGTLAFGLVWWGRRHRPTSSLSPAEIGEALSRSPRRDAGLVTPSGHEENDTRPPASDRES